MATKLTVEFPMFVLAGYNGGLSNLDVTLDDNITYLLGRQFYEIDVDFNVISMEHVDPIPNQNDELVRYEIEIGNDDARSCATSIIAELTSEGYARGCTIRCADGLVLHADLLTADITLRRQLQSDAT